MVKEYQATHVVPASGLPAWPAPDGTGPPAATLDPGLDIQVTERRADWAHIRCSNGWEAWIDGRNLVALTVVGAPPPPPPPPHSDAPAAAHTDAPAEAHADAPAEAHTDAPADADTDAPTTAAEESPADSPPVTIGHDDAAGTPAAPWSQAARDVPFSTATKPAPTAPTSPAPAAPTSPRAAWTSAEPPRPSAQPNVWASAGAVKAPAGRSVGIGQIVTLVGSALLVISSFLPWLRYGGVNVDTFDLTLNFLRDATTTDSGLKIGVALVVLGGLGVVTLFVREVRWLGIVTGILGILVGLRFIQQVDPFLDDLADESIIFERSDILEYGAYVAIAGGVIALVGGILALRSKPD